MWRICANITLAGAASGNHHGVFGRQWGKEEEPLLPFLVNKPLSRRKFDEQTRGGMVWEGASEL
jgi:hypothetical protein